MINRSDTVSDALVGVTFTSRAKVQGKSEACTPSALQILRPARVGNGHFPPRTPSGGPMTRPGMYFIHNCTRGLTQQVLRGINRACLRRFRLLHDTIPTRPPRNMPFKLTPLLSSSIDDFAALDDAAMRDTPSAMAMERESPSQRHNQAGNYRGIQ